VKTTEYQYEIKENCINLHDSGEILVILQPVFETNKLT
jgi:hypothetical protein